MGFVAIAWKGPIAAVTGAAPMFRVVRVIYIVDEWMPQRWMTQFRVVFRRCVCLRVHALT